MTWRRLLANALNGGSAAALTIVVFLLTLHCVGLKIVREGDSSPQPPVPQAEVPPPSESRAEGDNER